MLEIIDSLEPFFKDCYGRIHVREYARLQKISPPTASKLLQKFNTEGLLKQEIDKQYIYYYANKDSELFVDFSRVYWKKVLKNSGLIDYVLRETLSPVIILYGSLSKAEVKQGSDIDIAIFSVTKKELHVEKYEKILQRKIQIMLFKDIDTGSKALRNSILNGYRIEGSW